MFDIFNNIEDVLYRFKLKTNYEEPSMRESKLKQALSIDEKTMTKELEKQQKLQESMENDLQY